MFDNSPKNLNTGWAAILALVVLFGLPAGAVQSLGLAWNPSAASDVAGYHVYFGNHGSNFDYCMDAGTNTSFVVTGLQEGQTNTFGVTAYDAQGVESPTSNLISFIVPGLVNVAPKAGPGSPTVISFVVAPGHTYQLQASSDLTTWSTIWQTAATNNAWTAVQDVGVANLTMCFYRVAWQ